MFADDFDKFEEGHINKLSTKKRPAQSRALSRSIMIGVALFEGDRIALVRAGIAVVPLGFIFLHALEEFTVIAVGAATSQQLVRQWRACSVGRSRCGLDAVGEIPTGSQRERNRSRQGESGAGSAVAPGRCGSIARSFGRAACHQFRGLTCCSGRGWHGGFGPRLLKLGLEKVREELI